MNEEINTSNARLLHSKTTSEIGKKYFVFKSQSLPELCPPLLECLLFFVDPLRSVSEFKVDRNLEILWKTVSCPRNIFLHEDCADISAPWVLRGIPPARGPLLLEFSLPFVGPLSLKLMFVRLRTSYLFSNSHSPPPLQLNFACLLSKVANT